MTQTPSVPFDPFYHQQQQLLANAAVSTLTVLTAEKLVLVQAGGTASTDAVSQGYRQQMVPEDCNLFINGDMVRIEGPLLQRECDVQINARVLEVGPDGNGNAPSMDVSGKPGLEPDPDPVAPKLAKAASGSGGYYTHNSVPFEQCDRTDATPAKSGQPGKDGDAGATGGDAGWVDLRCGKLVSLRSATLTINAIGGIGGKGQDGQPGQEGGDGGKGANATHHSTTNDEATNGSNAGKGGLGGRGGSGGVGGNGGIVQVYTLVPLTATLKITVDAGKSGDPGNYDPTKPGLQQYYASDGANGKPGDGGDGCDYEEPGSAYSFNLSGGGKGGFEEQIARPDPVPVPQQPTPAAGDPPVAQGSCTYDDLAVTASEDQLAMLLDSVRIAALTLDKSNNAKNSQSDEFDLLKSKLDWLIGICGVEGIAQHSNLHAVGVGTDEVVTKAIQEGVMDGTIVSNNFGDGYLSLLMLGYLYKGYTPAADAYTVNSAVYMAQDSLNNYDDCLVSLTNQIKNSLPSHFKEKPAALKNGDLAGFKAVWYAPDSDPYFDDVQRGVEAFEKDFEVTVEKQIGTDWHQDSQTKNVKALVAQGKQYFSIFRADPQGANKLYRDDAVKAAEFVNFGADTAQPTSALFVVAADAKATAMQATEQLIEAMGCKGNILSVLEASDDPDTIQRKAGVTATVQKYPDVKILQELADVKTLADAVKKIQDALSKAGDQINGIIATTPMTSDAVAKALRGYKSSTTIGRGAAGVRRNLLDPRLDAFGNTTDWVPMASLNIYNALLGDETSGSLAVLKEAETEWQVYSELRIKDEKVQSQVTSGVNSANSQISDLQSQLEATHQQLVSLSADITAMATDVEDAKKAAQDQFTNVKKMVGDYFNLQPFKYLDVIEQTAYAMSDPISGSIVYGTEELKFWKSTIGDIPGDDGQTYNKSYVIGRMDQLKGDLSNLDEAYQAYDDGFLQLDDPDGYKLLASQDSVDQLLNEFKQTLPGVQPAEDAMKAYVQEVLKRNGKILDYNSALANLAQLKSEIDKLTEQKSQLSAQAAALSLPLADRFLQRLYERAKQDVINDLYDASRAYRFWSLSDVDVFGDLAAGSYSDVTFASALQAKQKVLTGKVQAINQLIDKLQPRTAPVCVTFKGKDHPKMILAFRKDRGSDANGVPRPHFWEFTLDPPTAGTTSDENPFADMTNVRVDEVRCWLVGLESTGKNGNVQVHVIQQGDEKIVLPTGSNPVSIRHEPIDQVFEYSTKKNWPSNEAVITPITYWKPLTSGELPECTPIGPFATWRIALRSQDFQNSEIKWDTLKSIRLEFFVRRHDVQQAMMQHRAS